MNYWVVGLGNPGTEYEKTRHNAGWLAIDFAYPDLAWGRNSYANAGVAKDGTLAFIKPATFMNESGQSVAYFMHKEGLEPERMIVVYDDIDLPLGKMKISFDRGSGGHNGIKSIEEHVGGRNFIRIRIGISKMIEGGQIAKPNVLGKFEAEEIEALRTLAPKVREALDLIRSEGKEKAMSLMNA
jgi:PTH1 family peptidyl-tRNA hydrolase